MLINYLPHFMQDFKEIQEIMEVSQVFADDINNETQNILNNMFIFEASESGVLHYEKIFNLTSKINQKLEDRKQVIFLKYNHKLPYTYKSLIMLLNSSCGEGFYNIYISNENLTLSIKISLKKKDMIENIKNSLEEILPMNIELDISLICNVWKTLSDKTWGDLKSVSWGRIKEEEYDERNREL